MMAIVKEKAAKITSIKLSDAQREVVQGHLGIMKNAQNQAGLFLQYVVKENKLEGDWNLSEDGTTLNLQEPSAVQK